MTRKPRELSTDEKRLWRRVADGVKARRPLPAIDNEGAAEPAAPKVGKRVPAAVPAPTPATRHSPPADRGGERRVQRGQVEIAGRLDLHGYTYDDALAALEGFLSRAHRSGARTVLVITGHGRGGEGVLKKNLPLWLARPPLRALVSGYARAHRTHGGAGAAYVFLKRKGEAR